MRVASEPVGEVDSEPLAAEAAIGQRGSASIRIRAQDRSAGCGKRRHRRTGADREKGAAPLLRIGFQETDHEHVERPEANTEPVQLLPIRLLERADGAHQRAAGKDSAGIGQHCRQRPDSGRRRAVGRSRGELLERSEMTVDLRVEPGFEAGPQFGPAMR